MTFRDHPGLPPAGSPHVGTGSAASTEWEVAAALRGVIDPEIGLNIADLGLIKSARRTADGIHVLLMMTTPSCPMAELLADEARTALRERFPDAAVVTVEVCRDAVWSPARISDAGQRALGWAAPPKSAARRLLAWSASLFAGRKRH
jgi:metal-sulfur cluster biosynthetic enzyme